MLSDEEKEALDKLSSKKNESTWGDTIRQIKREDIKDVVVTRQKYITAVLNLIETQQKEIEELKNTETYKIAIIDKDKYVSKDKIKEIIYGDYTDLGIIIEIRKLIEE